MFIRSKKIHLFIIFSMFVCLIVSGCSTKSNNISEKSEAKACLEQSTNIIKVQQGEDIQEAIQSAKDGSEIIISSGTYIIDKPILINDKKNITITGAGEVKVFGKRVDHQIIMIKDSENIILNNIRACHKEEEGSKKVEQFERRNGSVVDVDNCGGVTFNECEFEGCGVYGIYTDNTREINIQGCYIHHNSWKALGFYNKQGVTNVFIKGSNIINNADFIEKDDRVNVNLEEGNVIKDNNQEGYNSK